MCACVCINILFLGFPIGPHNIFKRTRSFMSVGKSEYQLVVPLPSHKATRRSAQGPRATQQQKIYHEPKYIYIYIYTYLTYLDRANTVADIYNVYIYIYIYIIYKYILSVAILAQRLREANKIGASRWLPGGKPC